MLRRLFLQSLYTVGDVFMPPASAFGTQDSSCATANSRPIHNFHATPLWADDIPKIGLVAVGSINSVIFTNLHRDIPYLSSRIAIDSCEISLREIRTNFKVQVGYGRCVPVNADEAKLHAQDVIPEIVKVVSCLDIVLLVVEMNDISGAGIAQVVAQVLREQKILTLAVSAMPSYYDAMSHREKQIAHNGVEQLRKQVDALIHLSSNDIERAAGPNAPHSSLMNQFPLAFIQLSRSITNSVCKHEEVGIDLDDLRKMLNEKGECAFGFASATLSEGAQAGANRAVNHTFLGCDRLSAASAVLVSIESPKQALLLREAKALVSRIRGEMASGAPLLYASTTNTDSMGKFEVSILASGIRGV